MTLIAAGVSLAGSIRWSAEIPEVIKIIAGVITGAGTLLLFFKRVRNKIYSIYDYFYQKLPSVRAHFQKINQIAETLPQMGEQLSRIEIRGAITQSLAWGMLDNTEDAYFLTDKLGGVTKTNKTFTRWVNESEENLKDDGWITYLTSDCRNYVRDEIEKAVDEKRGFNGLRCSFRRNGTIIINAEISFTPIKSDGQIHGYKAQIKKI